MTTRDDNKTINEKILHTLWGILFVILVSGTGFLFKTGMAAERCNIRQDGVISEHDKLINQELRNLKEQITTRFDQLEKRLDELEQKIDENGSR